ncbi:MAG TPA: hypothetical protein VFB42_06610 [Gaiellaceae bacterium]|nr:hypothetical protein [Gaiellaceae bacterium]
MKRQPPPWDDLNEIIDYLYKDECRHWLEQQELPKKERAKAPHIFERILVVGAWLDANGKSDWAGVFEHYAGE